MPTGSPAHPRVMAANNHPAPSRVDGAAAGASPTPVDTVTGSFPLTAAQQAEIPKSLRADTAFPREEGTIAMPSNGEDAGVSEPAAVFEAEEARALEPRESDIDGAPISRGLSRWERLRHTTVARPVAPRGGWIRVSGCDSPDKIIPSLGLGIHTETSEFRAHCYIHSSELTVKGRTQFAAQLVERACRLQYHQMPVPAIRQQYCSLAFVRHPDEMEYVQYCTSRGFHDDLVALRERGTGDEFRRVDLGCLTRGTAALFPFMAYEGVPWERFLEDVPAFSSDEQRAWEGGDVSVLDRYIARLANPRPRVSAYPLVRVVNGEMEIHPHYSGTEVPKRLFKGWREEFVEYAPLAWRRYEREMRHRYGVLLCYFQTEATCLTAEAVRRRYLGVPTWWHEVEVPYQFLAPMPCVVAYCAHLWRHPEKVPGADVMLRSEWAFRCAEHLLLECCAGRLFWIPHQLREDIRSLGLHREFTGMTGAQKLWPGRLNKVLRLIDRIAWSRLPEDGIFPELPELPRKFAGANPLQPSAVGFVTPVFETPDWVAFDAEAWTTWLPPPYWVEGSDTENPLAEVPRRRRVLNRHGGDPTATLPPKEQIHAWRRAQYSRLATLPINNGLRRALRARMGAMMPHVVRSDSPAGHPSSPALTGLRSTPVPPTIPGVVEDRSPLDTPGVSASRSASVKSPATKPGKKKGGDDDSSSSSVVVVGVVKAASERTSKGSATAARIAKTDSPTGSVSGDTGKGKAAVTGTAPVVGGASGVAPAAPNESKGAASDAARAVRAKEGVPAVPTAKAVEPASRVDPPAVQGDNVVGARVAPKAGTVDDGPGPSQVGVSPKKAGGETLESSPPAAAEVVTGVRATSLAEGDGAPRGAALEGTESAEVVPQAKGSKSSSSRKRKVDCEVSPRSARRRSSGLKRPSKRRARARLTRLKKVVESELDDMSDAE